MIHMLFNNVFVEGAQEGNKESFNYPINSDNDQALLFMLDIYNKAQTLFAVNVGNNEEYLDTVNYIELNFP